MAEGHAAIKERKKWSAVWLLGAGSMAHKTPDYEKLVHKLHTEGFFSSGFPFLPALSQ